MARRGRCLPSQLPWLSPMAADVEGAWYLVCLDHYARVIGEQAAEAFARQAKGGLTVTMRAPGD